MLFTLAAVGAYPFILIPLIVVGAVVWLDRRQRARAAIASRADYEHHQLMAASVKWQPVGASARPGPTGLPTLPPRRRPADHRSITEPIRREPS
ncbi:hypothetical protein [Mycobacterium camsae]|uniref:hypothetical protein n=1 Tax=Mycobacterium gordonae TaxID=1778 RepID=UPI00197D0194|nr:hypothetical protein [Mycobacterium gordonae]